VHNCALLTEYLCENLSCTHASPTLHGNVFLLFAVLSHSPSSTDISSSPFIFVPTHPRRPNVGKSTLINALLNDSSRLVVSPRAHTTRDSITIDFQHEGRAMKLIDTAGLGTLYSHQPFQHLSQSINVRIKYQGRFSFASKETIRK
jgi:hypothetical protein